MEGGERDMEGEGEGEREGEGEGRERERQRERESEREGAHFCIQMLRRLACLFFRSMCSATRSDCPTPHMHILRHTRMQTDIQQTDMHACSQT